MIYGLLDTKDNLWIGNSAGPKLFSSEEVINGEPLGASARS